MKLPFKLLDKKEKAQYYLALILQNEKVTSVIFEKEGIAIKYVSSDEESFKDTIENATENEFLDVLDKVITTAETSLPDNVETHKTLFGLKDSWIEEDKIKKEYLDRLKKASDELALEPIGFLAFSESLINLMQKEEGAPITAILVNVGKKYLTVYWIKGGKIVESKTSEIHENASFTADALIKHLQSGGTMPAKVVLFDSDDEELEQEFISHQWSKSIAFMHLPQIKKLPEDAGVKAMLLGAATQMGTQLIYSDLDKPQAKQEPEIVRPSQDKNEAGETQEETSDMQANDVDSFEINDDEKGSDVKEQTAEYFGFIEGADVTKSVPEKISEEKTQVPFEMKEELIENIPNEIKDEEEKKFSAGVNAALVFTKIKSIFPVILKLTKKVKINKETFAVLKSKNKLLFIIPIILVILLLGIFYLYLFKTTAQINVFVNPREDQKDTSVTFTSSTDLANKNIAFETITVSEDGSVSTNATGKKFVGDKAKGTVTIFNNSDSAITLASGTKITSPNSLSFTTDAGVSVASASGDIFSGTKPGTANVAISASDIGQDYNLPSGTKFSVSGGSDIAAKNDTAFSGGTKKAITVVSADDLIKLTSDLPKNLEQKAKDDLKSKSQDNKTILPQFISKTVDDKTFDKKEGDQSSSVSLKATVNFEAISYLNKDMEDLANSLFSSNEDITTKNLSVSADNIKVEKNNDITADLTIKAQIMPKVDVDSLRKQLVKSSKLKATNMLSNISQVQEVNITFNPDIPLLPKNLPSDYKKIFINITSK